MKNVEAGSDVRSRKRGRGPRPGKPLRVWPPSRSGGGERRRGDTMRAVKVTGVSMVRNEADVIAASVLHHLSMGLDSIFVLDNGSTDGTPEVLRDLANADGRVRWARDDSPFDQAAITTELAREAHDQGADWVLPFDADEFWWAPGGLRGILAGSDAGALGVRVANFVQARARHESSPDALLTMTRRPAETVPPGTLGRRMVESQRAGFVQVEYPLKWISRPTDEIKVWRGNHRVEGVRGKQEVCGGIVCLHAPLRSRALLASKVERARRLTEAGKTHGGAWHVWRWARVLPEGKLNEEWAANSYGERGHLDVYGRRNPTVYDPRLSTVVGPHVRRVTRSTGRWATVRRALVGTATRARRVLAEALAAVVAMPSARRELEETRQELTETRRRLRQARRQAERRNERIVERHRRTGEQLRNVARDYLLCKMPEGSVCAEIGVHEGDFSRQILDAVGPERLHLIDPWRQGEGLFGKQAASEQATVEERYAGVRERFAEEIEAGRVVIHRALSSEVVEEFPDSYLGWVYVDGNHLYEFVKQDLELYYPKVQAGGYLAGDDYGVRGYWENGVQRAVDEFVSGKPGAVLEVKGSQFIIRKGATPPG